ncbi:hypothetical protein [Lentibacillus salinarum]|uniref:YtzI protein n=1 Tax=Lentibacillus salinarum TaxID=446820 RepID=A0ABW3ZTQ5_9BACI
MGKKVVLLVITGTLAILIAGWFALQYVIDHYDVDRDTSQPVQTDMIQDTDTIT